MPTWLDVDLHKFDLQVQVRLASSINASRDLNLRRLASLKLQLTSSMFERASLRSRLASSSRSQAVQGINLQVDNKMMLLSW